MREWLPYIIAGALVFAILPSLMKLLRASSPPKVAPRPLMTRMERRTITCIEMVIPWARVHAQVSMGAILKPRGKLSRSQATTIRNRFSSKRIDFVVEHPTTGEIIMLIELDDSTHNARNDRWRDTLTKSAGYITIRLPAGEVPSRQSIYMHIRAAAQQHPKLSDILGEGPGVAKRSTRAS
ncbi:DUF2726 domain-containing protein [Novosphingobium profundi]|jgi:hypothetical protein|uniref:DUF2726 domain-containing protein n=1 Tax=Novosphingobium profundi TaxID=1774954 RepID=UPI001BD9961F|nr:DUF2726 domain-containing protein [Novosphingobium profundi]MBT0671113.1 DUF2726 domain-containing protein [Novosphingobium profundi]